MSRHHYQWGYGTRGRSNWGTGDILSRYAEGDVVTIPGGAPAFLDGRIPHAWSEHPELSQPGHYRVVSVFSIGEEPSFYYRVCPIVGHKTLWDERSDRIHVLVGDCDYTHGWTLVRSADPDNLDRLDVAVDALELDDSDDSDDSGGG